MPDTIPERAVQDIYVSRIPDAAEASMLFGERQGLHIGIPDFVWFGTFLSLNWFIHRVSLYMAVCCVGTANRRVIFLCLRLIHRFDSDVSAVILRVPAAERNTRNGQLRVDPWEFHPSGDFPKPPSLPDSPIKGCCDWTEVALSSCVLRHSGSHTRFASLSVVYRSLR